MSRLKSGVGSGAQSCRSLAVLSALALLAILTLSVVFVAILVLRPRFDLGSMLESDMPTVAAPVAGIFTGNNDTDPAVPESPGSAESWPQATAAATPNPLRAKLITDSGSEPRLTWTATPLPTNTSIPSPTPNPTFVSSAYGLGNYMPSDIAHDERWIDVDVTAQKLVAYEGVIPVFETLVSTGTANYPTVTGQFRIWLRFQSQDMDGYRLGYDYYLKGVPYVQYFYEDYALHGTYWHSNFGRPMSHGCVNLSPADSEWLFNWAGYGTLVNVHP
ncbi:MAG: L,D-transpeptidase family protein [Chloroflexota bacterium]|nr:MAG: L,D-transpeptidase family protein [Chloroflexota bacterium]